MFKDLGVTTSRFHPCNKPSWATLLWSRSLVRNRVSHCMCNVLRRLSTLLPSSCVCHMMSTYGQSSANCVSLAHCAQLCLKCPMCAKRGPLGAFCPCVAMCHLHCHWPCVLGLCPLSMGHAIVYAKCLWSILLGNAQWPLTIMYMPTDHAMPFMLCMPCHVHAML